MNTLKIRHLQNNKGLKPFPPFKSKSLILSKSASLSEFIIHDYKRAGIE